MKVLGGRKKLFFPILSNRGDDFWFGADDIAVEGSWRWNDGTNVNHYTNWYVTPMSVFKRSQEHDTRFFRGTGEPNNGLGRGQDCMRFRSDGKWDDNYCTERMSFICQRG